MSTLNTTNIKHSSSASNNIVLDSSANATLGANATVSGNLTVSGTGNQSIAGTLQFNSGYGSVATAFGVRAWIDFDGTAATIGTGNGSGNMDAVTDNGTGDYTVNFTTDMPDNNYCPIITGTRTASDRVTSGMIKPSTTLAVGGFTVNFKEKTNVSFVSSAFYDPVDVCIAVVR
jgi:hypothetical protein